MLQGIYVLLFLLIMHTEIFILLSKTIVSLHFFLISEKYETYKLLKTITVKLFLL